MKVPAVRAKTLCDKCGKDIETQRYGSAPTVIKLSVTNPWWPGNGGSFEEWDFCCDCWSSVFQAMKAVVK